MLTILEIQGLSLEAMDDLFGVTNTLEKKASEFAADNNAADEKAGTAMETTDHTETVYNAVQSGLVMAEWGCVFFFFFFFFHFMQQWPPGLQE